MTGLRAALGASEDSAVGAGLLALHWLVQGHGFEITSADVREAYAATLAAAERGGELTGVKERVRELAPRDDAFQRLAQEIEGSGAMARLLALGPGESLAGTELEQARVLTTLRRALKAKTGKAARARALAPTEHWALAEGYEGIERAGLMVVNVRSAADRSAAEGLVAEVARLRKDEEVGRDVLGRRGSRIPVTAVVADLSDPGDAGLKKAVARVKRAVKAGSR